MKNVNNHQDLRSKALSAINNYLDADSHMTNSSLMEGFIDLLGGADEWHSIIIDNRDMCSKILEVVRNSDLDYYKPEAINLMERMEDFFNDLYTNMDAQAGMEVACIEEYDAYTDAQLENIVRRYELKMQLDILEKERSDSDNGSMKKIA